MTLPVNLQQSVSGNDVVLLVRDSNLVTVGQIDLRDVISFSFTDRFSAIGAWTLKTAAQSQFAEALATPGYGLIFQQNGYTLMSGPVISISKDESAGQNPVYTVIGATDEIILTDIAFPDTTKGDAATTPSQAYDTRSGAASTVMYGYVSDNIGPTAQAARKRPTLSIAPDTVLGSTVSFSARYDALTDMLGQLATAGGVGYRVVQVPGQTVQLQVYATTDKTKSIRFSIDNETLASYSWTQKAPDVTRVVVAGEGEGTARTVFQVTNDASYIAETMWNQIKVQFLDERSTSDVDQLTQYAQNRLEDGGITATAIKFEPVDTNQVQFGRDYQLGDRVTVIVDSLEISDVVEEVTVTLDSNGVSTSISIGNVEAIAVNIADMLIKKQRDLTTRISQLERNP